MYTKSVIDRLTEKLAEELSPAQLEELTRLCEGVYDPAAFNLGLPGYERIVACGAGYYNSERCNQPQVEFNHELCMDEGRFDWGSCEEQSNFENGVAPGPSCQHPFVCTSYDCPGGGKFTCSGSTEALDPFNCSQDFDCPVHVTCYAGFTCGNAENQFECVNYHGCAEGYACPTEFACKGNNGFTCGEGVGGPVPPNGYEFECGASGSVFDCGYEDTSGHGSFECRETHNCPQTFTCFLSDVCGTSPNADKFTCGTGNGPETGNFYCSEQQQCLDVFECKNTHTCGDGHGTRDNFTCGNGPEKDTFTCENMHNCMDVFHCKDVHHCNDVFLCGNSTQEEDEFRCGDGENHDEFTCGSSQPQDIFDCLGQVFDCDDQFECKGFQQSNFTCSAQNPGETMQFTCGNTFNCTPSSGGNFGCLDEFTCEDDFFCGDSAGSGSFQCGDQEGGAFRCGSIDRRVDEFGCSDPSLFDCQENGGDSYHCPLGMENAGFNCTEAYTCDDNPDYECSSSFTCADSTFECNTDEDAVFRCTNGTSAFDCASPSQFKCMKLFACNSESTETNFQCPETDFTCGTQSVGEAFRCDGTYECSAGFNCAVRFKCQAAPPNNFVCQGGPTGDETFSCGLGSQHHCVSGFACVHDDFQCGQSTDDYICQGLVFECSGGAGGQTGEPFKCGGDDHSGVFQCSDGERLDFNCGRDATSGNFECTQAGVDGFTCSTQHIFLCDPTMGYFNCTRFTCRPSGHCDDVHRYNCGGNPIYSLPGDFACMTSHRCVQSVQCGNQNTQHHDFYCYTQRFDCDTPSGVSYSCSGYQNVDCLGENVSFQCGISTTCFSAEGGYYCQKGPGVPEFECSGDKDGVSCFNTFTCPVEETPLYICTGGVFNCEDWGQQGKDCSEGEYACDDEPDGFACRDDEFRCDPSNWFCVPCPPEAGSRGCAVQNIGRPHTEMRRTPGQPFTSSALIGFIAAHSQIRREEAADLLRQVLLTYFKVDLIPAEDLDLREVGVDLTKLLTKLGYGDPAC